jgi:acyl-CoA synthetase (AMP-forming)/AMP-acid ligase II
MVQTLFSDLDRHADRACLIAPGRRWTYGEALADAEALFAGRDLPERGLAFIHGHNSPEALLAYIGAVRRGYAVHLLDPSKFDANEALIARYRPEVVINTNAARPLWIAGQGGAISDEIAILLSTSGSTGTPKLVKLSHGNIVANTRSIIDYLGLCASDVGITSLKPFYSYGMSVVNTHLVAGAALVVTDLGMDDAAFRALARREGVTNIAGVPFSFELMDRRGFDPGDVPTLRLLTQAGGRLAPHLVRRFAREGARHGVGFCVMYGQTEAAPRMSWLSPELAAEAPGSIGRAIPGGRLSVVDADGHPVTEPGVSGELVYEGPNVMVGYAETRADLAFTEAIPALHTGDIAHFDERGLFYIDGRLSRFVKPYGVRVSLDDIETVLRRAFPDVAVTGTDARIVVGIGAPLGDRDGLARRLSQDLGLPRAAFLIVADCPVPRLSSGKIDYKTLLAAHAAPKAAPRLATVFLREFTGLLTGRARPPASVLEAYRAVLGARVKDHGMSFREAGGDSLSFMQVLLLLEGLIGELPDGWDEMTVLELERLREAAFA